MSTLASLMIGLMVGIGLTAIWLWFGTIRHIKQHYELHISELMREHQGEVSDARKSSVNSSRAVIKGKIAEQFAPLFPEFNYYPNDAKFLGDPIDYIVFSGYSDFREGLANLDDLEIVFIDIKTGNAQLSPSQQAIQYAVAKGRVRFETIRIQLDDD